MGRCFISPRQLANGKLKRTIINWKNNFNEIGNLSRIEKARMQTAKLIINKKIHYFFALELWADSKMIVLEPTLFDQSLTGWPRKKLST